MNGSPQSIFTFALDTTAKRSGNTVTLTRQLEGRSRKTILTLFEAMLCAVLERGADPTLLFDWPESERAKLTARIARLSRGLRAFLVPLESPAGLSRGTALETPLNYANFERTSWPASMEIILRDLAPVELVWYVTHRCPRTCRYCHWVEKGRADLEADHLSHDKARALVREAWLGGVDRLILTGGEPMLRADIYDIIAESSDLGLPVWLFTRFPITEERAVRLSKVGVSRVFYSLDSTESRFNAEMVENQNAANEAHRSLATLVAAGIDVTVVPVITRLNANGLSDLARSLSDIGVRQLRPICYKGRKGSNVNEQFTLTELDKRFVREGLNLAESWLEVDRSTLNIDVNAGICESGISSVYVQPNGAVSYCPLTSGNAGAAVAFLPQDSLSDIWHSHRIASLLSQNSLALAGPRHIARVSHVSSCFLRNERLDLI